VAAIALLLWLPAVSSARSGRTQTEQGASSRTALISAGLLARWAGYGSEHGSDAVRGVQSRLRRLGFRPGPIDGLFGPLTEGAVVRFQTARGLSRDGVVGPATRRSLLDRPPGRRSRPASRGVGRHSRHRAAPASRTTPGGPSHVVVRPAPDRPAPMLVAGLGALAAALLLGGAWLLARRPRGAGAPRRGRSPATRLRPGIVCAALIAVFAIGAVAGALFATRAAPGERGTVEAKGTAAVPAVAGVARATEATRNRPRRSLRAP
jgi:peptidoglycan hydrolase-like protein with peptidoglycan-binding domain